jgi:hypothetical protein
MRDYDEKISFYIKIQNRRLFGDVDSSPFSPERHNCTGTEPGLRF